MLHTAGKGDRQTRREARNGDHGNAGRYGGDKLKSWDRRPGRRARLQSVLGVRGAVSQLRTSELKPET